MSAGYAPQALSQEVRGGAWDAASLTGPQGLPLLLLGGALGFGDHCSGSPNPAVTT